MFPRRVRLPGHQHRSGVILGFGGVRVVFEGLLPARLGLNQTWLPQFAYLRVDLGVIGPMVSRAATRGPSGRKRAAGCARPAAEHPLALGRCREAGQDRVRSRSAGVDGDTVISSRSTNPAARRARFIEMLPWTAAVRATRL